MRRVRRVFFRLAAPEGFWAGCLDLTHTNSGSLHQRGRLTRLYHRLSWQNYARRGAGCQLDDVYARNVCAGNSQLAFVWGRGGTTRATGSWNRRRLLRVVSPGRGRARQAGEELLVNGQHLPRLSRPYHSPGAARPGHLRARQAGEELLVNGQHLPRLSRPYRGCLFCPASVRPVLVLVDAA